VAVGTITINLNFFTPKQRNNPKQKPNQWTEQSEGENRIQRMEKPQTPDRWKDSKGSTLPDVGVFERIGVRTGLLRTASGGPGAWHDVAATARAIEGKAAWPAGAGRRRAAPGCGWRRAARELVEETAYERSERP